MKIFSQSDCSSIFLNPNTIFENEFLPDCKPVQGNFIVEHINEVSGPLDVLVSIEIGWELELPAAAEELFWQNIQVTMTSTGTLIPLTPVAIPAIGNFETARRFSFRQEDFTYNYPNGVPFQVSIQLNTVNSGFWKQFIVRVVAEEEGCPFNPDNASPYKSVLSKGVRSYTQPIQGGVLQLAAVGTLYDPPSTVQSLSIEGNLVVDVNYEIYPGIGTTWFRGDLYLYEGATITVKSGHTLRLRGLDLHTCDHLARGIIVEPGATLIADDVHFEDCRFAIDARPGSKIDIRNSNFTNNYLGLNAQLAAGDAPVQLLGFFNNTFSTSPSGIKLPYAGMPEQVGAVGYAGIRAENCNDFNAWSPNSFDNLANGILLRNSNSNLDNLTMTKMVSDAAYPVSGFGVNTISDNNNSFLILGRHGVSSFKGVGAAIGAKGIGGEISNCQIDDAEVGITWVESQNRDKILLNNNITAKTLGINSYRCEPNIVEGTFNSRMQDNTIFAPRGILASESSSTANGKGWRILHNTITSTTSSPTQTTICINYGAGRNGWVNDNTISAIGPNAKGIDAVKLENAVISLNKITGSNELNNLGILLRSNTNSIVECNTPIKSQTGIRLIGPNAGTRLKTNRFSQLATGLEYGSPAMQTAFTGVQNHHGNIWYNNNVTLGAIHWETPTNSAVMSRFIVDIPESFAFIDATGAKSFMPSTREPMFAWFQNFPNDTLSAYCPIPLPLVPAIPGSEWQTQILGGSYEPSIFKEAQLFKLRSDVMQKVTEQPQLSIGNTIYQDFQYAYSGSVLQKLSEASFDKNTLFDMSGVQATNWHTKYELMRAKSSELAVLDKQRQAGVGVSASQYNQKKQAYTTARQEFEQLNMSIRAQKSIMAGAYKAENGLINPSTIWETNQKAVNDIQFRLVQTNQELTGQEMKTLELIALQCPLLGGDAVFEARALLGFRTDLQYDDDTQCQADIRNNVQNRQSTNGSNPSTLVIYPNPTNGHILLDAYLGKRLLISDVYGRVFIEKDIFSPRVDVSQLPSGMYQVCVSDDFTRLMCGNLMVTDK